MPHTINAQAIIALVNAARRANTSAGWRSAKPFLAMDSRIITILDGDDDEPSPSSGELEGQPDERGVGN